MNPRLFLRGWYYFRVGQSAYLSLVVGLVQFLFVATLYLQRIPAFADLHFTELAILFLVPYGVLAVGTGYVHTKKQMDTDNMIASLQNPFLVNMERQIGEIEKLLRQLLEENHVV